MILSTMRLKDDEELIVIEPLSKDESFKLFKQYMNRAIPP